MLRFFSLSVLVFSFLPLRAAWADESARINDLELRVSDLESQVRQLRLVVQEKAAASSTAEESVPPNDRSPEVDEFVLRHRAIQDEKKGSGLVALVPRYRKLARGHRSGATLYLLFRILGDSNSEKADDLRGRIQKARQEFPASRWLAYSAAYDGTYRFDPNFEGTLAALRSVSADDFPLSNAAREMAEKVRAWKAVTPSVLRAKQWKLSEKPNSTFPAEFRYENSTRTFSWSRRFSSGQLWESGSFTYEFSDLIPIVQGGRPAGCGVEVTLNRKPGSPKPVDSVKVGVHGDDGKPNYYWLDFTSTDKAALTFLPTATELARTEYFLLQF